MLNYLWGSMILIAIITSCFNSSIGEIANSAIDSSKESVQLCITMLGVMSMWTGLMEIAQKSGLIEDWSKKMKPFLRFLFPNVPENHSSFTYISTNVIANILGLGWAATPAGIKAMESLQELNEKKDTASDEMCMFMIFNMSSLQILNVNILAYRSLYNSANPSEVIAPGIFATFISTIGGLMFAKLVQAVGRKKRI